MLISHELPNSLLHLSKIYNDYEYCLPSYYVKYEEYRDYYLEAKREGRFIILDNGLFEGDKFTTEQLIEIINELKPDIFVVPDEWNDTFSTYINAFDWIFNHKPNIFPGTELMVVLQGTSFDEIKRLYKRCSAMGYEHFAFNHSSIAYQDAFMSPNKLYNAMVGRIALITEMHGEDFIRKNHYIHLLGCSLPQEFLYYGEGYEFIKSVDTSNPVMAGLSGLLYNPWGLLDKIKDKLEKFIEVPNLMEEHELISKMAHNISAFRDFVNQK